MLRRFHWLPLVLLLAGFLASLLALTLRYQAEAKSRAVALVLDYAQFHALVAASGVPLDRAYHDFAAAGIKGIALTEETLADLETAGLLTVTTGSTGGGREFKVAIADPDVRERVAEFVARLAPAATEKVLAGERVVFDGAGGGKIYVPGRFEDLKLLPTGLDQREVDEVRNAGLRPFGRVFNTLSLTSASLRWELDRLKAQGIATVIFGGGGGNGLPGAGQGDRPGVHGSRASIRQRGVRQAKGG